MPFDPRPFSYADEAQQRLAEAMRLVPALRPASTALPPQQPAPVQARGRLWLDRADIAVAGLAGLILGVGVCLYLIWLLGAGS